MDNLSKLNSSPKEKYPLFFIYFTSSVFYLFLLYSSVIFIPYAYHDQVTYLIGPHVHRNISTYNMYTFLMGLGRPLTALTTGVTFLFINSVSDLIFVRAIAIFCLAFAMSLCATWFYRVFHNKVVSFFVSAIIFTLPGMQIHVFYGDISNSMAILFAFISAMLIQKVELNSISDLFRKKTVNLLLFFAALTAFMISSFFYVNDTCFLLLPTLAVILFTGISFWPQTRIKFIRDIVFYGLGCVAYFITYKIFFFPILDQRNMPEAHVYRFGIADDFAKKFDFFKDISFSAFNLWNIHPNKTVLYVFIAIIFSGIVLALIRVLLRRHKTTYRQRDLRFIVPITIAVIVLLLAGNTVNLIAVGGALFYRTIFVYMAMIVLLVVWALNSLKYVLPPVWREKFFTVTLCFIFVVSSFIACRGVLFNALNSYTELNFIRNKIARYIETGKKITSIHLIKPIPMGIGFNGEICGRGDEFNRNTTDFTQDIPWLIRAALIEFKTKERFAMFFCLNDEKVANSPHPGQITVSTTAYDERFVVPANTLIIDMNELLSVPRDGFSPKLCAPAPDSYAQNTTSMLITRRKETLSADLMDFKITASSRMNSDTNLSEKGLLDGATVWHAQAPPKYAEWVKFTCEDPVAIKKLKMKPQPNNNPGDNVHKRAPKNFVFQASDDESKWVDLLTVKDNLHKDGNDWHEWKIANDKIYCYYRLYITASGDPDLLTIHRIMFE